MEEYGDEIDDVFPDFNAWANSLSPLTNTQFNDPNAYHPKQISLHTTEAQAALPIVHQLFTSSLDLDHTIPGTAQLLATICKARLQSGDEFATEPPLGLWFILTSLVKDFGYHPFVNTMLGELLLSLARIEVVDAAGSPIVAGEGQALFWKDLPGWNLAFRDHLIKLPPASYEEDSPQMAEWENGLRNANSFQSFWLASAPADECPEQRQFAASVAQQMLREALEAQPDGSSAGAQRALCYVSAVMPWVYDSGPALLELCKKGGNGQQVPTAFTWLDEGVSGYDYQGEDGLNMERWNFWKQRLRNYGEMPEFDEEVKGAPEQMEKWERGESVEI